MRSVHLATGGVSWHCALLREAEALAAVLDDPRRLGRVSLLLCNYFYIMGAHDQALAARQRALALATASGEVVLQALANYFLGFTYWLQGNYHQLDASPTPYRCSREPWNRLWPGPQALRHSVVSPWGKRIYWLAAWREAHALAEGALAHARTHQERGNQAYALQLLGEIATHSDPPEVESATSLYQQALSLAEELGMRPLQAHCHLGLGTLYRKTDRPKPARAELTTAMALYRAMDMTLWIPQAEAALAQVQEGMQEETEG
jgi:tetratricopeptide (TPR) repeat protein